MHDLCLLRLELETLWVTHADGRLLHCRTPREEPPPLLVVGGSPRGLCWATSIEVPGPVAATVAEVLAGASAGTQVGWAPSSADRLVDLLGQVAALAPPHGGPSYVVPGPLSPAAMHVRSSQDSDVESLRGLMREEDRALQDPWVVALVDDAVAAVCETARSAPGSVEAGVWTYEPYRRRGHAAAVVAAWSNLVHDRTAFYSTSWDNAASQGVARRLGLEPLGSWWQLSRA